MSGGVAQGDLRGDGQFDGIHPNFAELGADPTVSPGFNLPMGSISKYGAAYYFKNGAAATAWVLVTAIGATPSAALTATYVGFGSAGNVLTGSASLTYNDTTKLLIFTGGTSSTLLRTINTLTTGAATSQVRADTPSSSTGTLLQNIAYGDTFAGLTFGLPLANKTHFISNRSDLLFQLGTTGVPFNCYFGNGNILTATLTATNNFMLGAAAVDVASSVLNVNASKTIASAAGAVWNGVLFAASTATFTGTTTITEIAATRFEQPTLNNVSGLTVTTAATVIIDAQPLALNSTTITNTYALLIKAGRFSVAPSATVASAAGAAWDGVLVASSTLTLTGTTTVTQVSATRLAVPTITAAGACTVTNASTFTVEGAPVAAGSAVLTNAYAVNVKGGVFRHVPDVTIASASGAVWDGHRIVQGTCTVTGTTTVTELASTRFYQPIITNVSAGLTVTQAGTVVIDNAPSFTGNAAVAAGPLGGAYGLWVKEGKSCFTTAQDDFAVLKVHGMSTTDAVASNLAMEWSRRDTICGYLSLNSTFSEGNVSAFSFDMRFSGKVRILDTSAISGGNVIFETDATHIYANKIVYLTGITGNVMRVPTDTTGNVSAATGRIPIENGSGVTKYLRYYDD